MKITEYLKNNVLFLDGGMGTLLQAQGLVPGELPERWNITHPESIVSIHKAYFDAGTNVVSSNTFGANRLKFSADELENIIKAALENARQAKNESVGTQEKWVALDIGPTGHMLAPYGDLDFEDAINVFAETVKLGVKYGADLIIIETMNDSYEAKAALLAAKENSSLPVFVSNAYGSDGKLMTGANPMAMVALLEGLGADAVGVNCSLGPKALAGIVEEYLKYASVPVLLKPNAGMPKVINGKTVYDVLPAEFAADMAALVEKGVRIVGGCCGTTPEYIAALNKEFGHIQPVKIEDKNISMVSSYTHAVTFGDKPVLIGERINPTGKKRFKEALLAKDIDYILNEGITQQEKGAQILDVNVGLPEINEEEMLKTVMCELQAVVDLPLQIDSSNFKAMETALRRYNGKALINSVNGKKESMAAVFPLAKKYGGLIVALTLDENGIPEKAEDRLEIAKEILKEAEKYGINKKDIIFDPLTLAISADSTAARETLKAISLIKKELDCNVSLGVSNISYGLPNRKLLNSTFFAMALEQGLDSAIMNPYSTEMMQVYYSFCTLNGVDDSCESYINFAESLSFGTEMDTAAAKPAEKESASVASDLQYAIIKGLKEQAAKLTVELIKTKKPLDIVLNEIIPALNTVGEGFEANRVYLPQLLMSAETAKAAFTEIKAAMPKEQDDSRCTFVLATVKGDIHDIGKNIVKLLLENYGFNVVDLGRDVSPREIVDKVVELHAPIAGMSALMTTTVPAMEETIRLIKKEAPWCKTVVGGAVLTPEYAKSIGADRYAKDAMEAVRYTEEVEREL